ncbi:hypothetical protein K2P56_01725 [Patescibacteria group bacterium]|nr:hypothetical protein [Patescibacteria group bacterium]
MKTISIIVGVLILVLLGALAVVYFLGGNTLLDNNKYRAPIEYVCANGKNLVAEFGDNVARISLSDNRVITLKQISADDSGITFANDVGVSFSIKDFSGFVVENGIETHPGCRVSVVDEAAS